jgi:AraC-like DNA-binding protein
MKPLLLKRSFENNSSFYYSHYHSEYFDRPWHYHKEIELVYISKSSGTKFIANHIQPFEDGDLTLIGADVPHFFKNDDWYYEKQVANSASCIFIHFDPAMLGEKTLSMPEFVNINKLFTDSAQGLQILGNTKKEVVKLLIDMDSQDYTKKLLSLLQILYLISKGENVKPILKIPYVVKNNHLHADKMNKIFDFIMQHYTKDIYLEEVASRLNMSTATFSRYFKTHTSKTFSEYIIEMRINRACKLLVENNHSVSEIGFMCGFENRANFYRHFKKQTGKVPKEYLKYWSRIDIKKNEF